MTYADSYQFDSGFETEMTLTIDSAYFAPDANFGGNTVLNLIGHTPEGEPRTRIYAIGADWETTDGGNTVKHPSKSRFNQSTNYARFVQAAIAIPGIAEYLQNKGPTTDARIWIDLTMDLQETEIVRGGVNRTTGEAMKPSRIMLPTAIRLPDQLPLPTPAAASSPSAADILRAKAAATNGASSLSEQLADTARKSDTFDAFLEVAAALPGVVEDETLVADVVDASPTGFYHRSRSL